MSKKLNLCISVILIVTGILVSVPKIVLLVIVSLLAVFSIGLLIYGFSSYPDTNPNSMLPRVGLWFTLILLVVNISVSRCILTSIKPSLFLEDDESRKYFIMALALMKFAGYIFCVLGLYFSIICVAQRVSEIDERFALDTMSMKFFEINNQLNDGIITKEEAEQKKNSLKDEVDFYSTMDGMFICIKRTFVFVISPILLTFAGAVLIPYFGKFFSFSLMNNLFTWILYVGVAIFFIQAIAIFGLCAKVITVNSDRQNYL